MEKDEALKLALQVLSACLDHPDADDAIAAIKEALAAPVREPPVLAELLCVCGAEWEWRNRDWELVSTPAAQRQWVGLTPDEFQFIYDNCLTPSNLIDMVEAKLKEKNA